MITPTSKTYFVPLSDSTRDLIERYADFNEEGYIAVFQIINKEVIEALHCAKEWLTEGFLANESLSEVWQRENPCSVCDQKSGCNITCRQKHAFDKEVYGGLLCGTTPAAQQKVWGSEEVKNMVRFKVRLGSISDAEQGLFFERDLGYSTGGVSVWKNGKISINGSEISLRPWSAALYTIFTLNPEGFPLAMIASERKKEFVNIYRNITKSTIKVNNLKAQLANIDGTTKLLNNKLSELNTQLKEAGVPQIFWVTTTSHKANNKPYYIPYLREEK